MRCRRLRALFPLCGALLLAARAAADAADLSPEAGQLALGAELSYFGTSEDASKLYVLVPRAAAQYAFDQHWSVAADWGLIAIDSVPDQGAAESVARSGNPSLLGLLRGKLGGVPYRVGLGGTVPIAGINRAGQGRLQHVAFNDAQGLDGLWDVWLWAPSRIAALSFGQLDFDLHPQLQLQVEVAPALLIPVYDEFGSAPADVFVPTAVSFSTHKGPLRLGLRVQAVLMPTNNVDKLQLALEPWLRLTLGSGFLEARYTANVDEPLAGERGAQIWGFHLGGGASL
jgi:hypothetical protein